MVSYNELLYFIELAQTLNFTRASERIGITQPSLSTAIKRLERFLNTALFIRNKHQVILTPAGKNLLNHSKQLIQLWDHTKASCLLSQNEIQGNITLGCHFSIALYFLPQFFPQLLKKYSKLEIKLRHDLSRKITEEIINFTIDIGIIVNPIKHPDLIIKKIFDDQMTCWRASSIMSQKMVQANNNVIICDPDLAQTQWILKNIDNSVIKFNRFITSNNLEVIASLTAAGSGIGILPARVAKSLYSSRLRNITHSPIYNDEICLVYRHENRNIKAIQVVIDEIKLLSNNVMMGI